MARLLNIAVCKDESEWHAKFIAALDTYSDAASVVYSLVDIDGADWIEKLADFDAVIWRPHYMGVEASSYLKEKVWFIERVLRKLVVPNFDTIWHFESKIAQSYLFQYHKIPHPRTVATFSYDDALRQMESFTLPVVYKKSYGAASKNVTLINDRQVLLQNIKAVFSRKFLKEGVLRKILPKNIGATIRYYSDENIFGVNQRCVYWQEFIPDNTRDLRVTVIGSRFAFGFYRNNRPNDFRASGSGRIDYDSPIPEEVIRYCLELNRTMNFDSMAYDLVFSADGSFKIIEMSYGYVASALYNTPGHYELKDGNLEYVAGHCWPQELWSRWLLERLGVKERSNA